MWCSLRSQCAAVQNVLLRRMCALCASAAAAHWSEATTLHEVHHIASITLIFFVILQKKLRNGIFN